MLASWSVAWIVSLMIRLQPVAPWRDSYESTARGILEGAQMEPIFQGESGLRRTVALDVALAWFESRFDPNASGDGGKSRGLYQVQFSGEPESVVQQTIRANRMIRDSFRVCWARPLEERLGWYASGGPNCLREGGIRASRHRMGKAKMMLGE